MQEVVENDGKLEDLLNMIKRVDEAIFQPLKDSSRRTSSTTPRQLSPEINRLLKIFCSCVPRLQRPFISF